MFSSCGDVRTRAGTTTAGTSSVSMRSWWNYSCGRMAKLGCWSNVISCVTWLREICPRSKGSARHWCTYDSTLTTGTYVTWEPAAHTFMWPCLRVRVRVFFFVIIKPKYKNKPQLVTKYLYEKLQLVALNYLVISVS